MPGMRGTAGSVTNPKALARYAQKSMPPARRLDALIPLLHDGDQVLDLGCGCGVPATAILAERYAVTGVDISPVQIARAQQLVPRARFQCTDMATLEFPPQSFAAIVSFYAMIHLPLDEQPGIFKNIHLWLKPGGYLLATVGSGAWTGSEGDWLGAPMYWSHADRGTYLTWLEGTGFAGPGMSLVPQGSGGVPTGFGEDPHPPSAG